jgi:hypothetical protein
MDYRSIFAKYDWVAGTWVILTALFDWAALVVDPSGEAVPAHIYKQVLHRFPDARCQSPEQQQRWHTMVSRFYDRILDLSEDYEKTFSPESLSRLHEDLSHPWGDDERTSQFPFNKAIAVITNENHAAEMIEGQQLAQFMFQMDREDAFKFLVNLSITWASELPSAELSKFATGQNEAQSRGHALYLLAEQLE